MLPGIGTNQPEIGKQGHNQGQLGGAQGRKREGKDYVYVKIQIHFLLSKIALEYYTKYNHENNLDTSWI